jgi:hypothetical protein
MLGTTSIFCANTVDGMYFHQMKQIREPWGLVPGDNYTYTILIRTGLLEDIGP